MIRGISLGEVEDYVLKADIDNPTIWKLGVVDSISMAYVRDRMAVFEQGGGNPEDRAKTTLTMNSADVDLVRFGLRGFANFIGANGSPVEFKTEEKYVNGKMRMLVSDEVIMQIPSHAISELADVIKSKNVLRPEEAKNSDWQSISRTSNSTAVPVQNLNEEEEGVSRR